MVKIANHSFLDEPILAWYVTWTINKSKTIKTNV